jgi:hypothetical protein
VQLLGKTISEWLDIRPLTNGEVRTINLGAPGSGQSATLRRSNLFLTFGFISSHTCTLEVIGAYDFNFAVTDTLYTIPALAATYTTPYDMPAPYNTIGQLPLTRPLIRLVLSDTAAANHTYTRFYAKAWG